MLFTGERLSLKDIGGINQARYEFASRYVKNKKVIEFGCAFGYGSYMLSKSAKSVTAIDADKKSILYAKKNFNNRNITYKVKRIENFKNDTKYDDVIAFEIIEHLNHPEILLTQASRLLNKDGNLIISTPNRNLSSYDGNKPSNPYHVKEYYAHEFESLLKRYFKKVSMFGIILKDDKKIHEENIKKNLRWQVSAMLTKKRWIRRLVNFVPETPKRIFTGESGLVVDAKDFHFSKKNVSKAPYFVAVCKI